MGFQSQRAGAGALHLTLASVALAAFTFACGPAAAQDWPNKPVTFIVPFAAGGGTDAFARPLTAQLDKQLNQRFLIDNRAGAGGTVGASAAAKAEPNGYNFFVGAAHHAIAPAIYLKLDYDLEKDFVPVVLIAAPPQVVTVNPSKVQAKTLAEFIAYLKANPNKVDYASAGRGTTHHLSGELFQILSGTQMNHVPYRGAGPAMQDLVSGQIHVMFDGLGTSANQIQSGTLRGLAVAAPAAFDRDPGCPDLGGSRIEGFRSVDLVCAVRAKGHAAGDRYEDGGRSAQGAGFGSAQGNLGEERLRHAKPGGPGVRKIRQFRSRALGRRGEEGRHQAGVIERV